MCASPTNSFPNGARWLRADFHLHTPADRSHFEQPAVGSNWHEAYIARLMEEKIGLGVLTNHNQFDLAEYKTLRKASNQAGITLLPGVELSVQGGRTGVHILVVLDPESWVFNKEAVDFPNRFLDEAFQHEPNRKSEDTACRWTLLQALESLNDHRQHGRDSFVILAHVDDAKGAFKELGAGLGQHFNELFRRSVLGAQKVRSHNNWTNLSQWLGGDAWQPARVEGSDCKSLDQVGKAHLENELPMQTWLKLGATTFAAVRLALSPAIRKHRLASTPPQPAHSRIAALSWRGAGGLLDGQSLPLSSDLNTLIGIRGSGKSTLLECLRYVLDLPVSAEADPDAYKPGLVERALCSGGKITAELHTRDGITYRVERTLRESPKVFRDGVAIPNLRPASLVRARYFGQKDLAAFGERRFADELIKRFLGSVRDDAEDTLRAQIEQRLVTLAQGRVRLAKIDEVFAELAHVEEDLRRFQEHGLAEKLREQIAHEKDLDHAVHAAAQIADTCAAFRSARDDHADALRALASHQPAGDGAHYGPLRQAIDRAIAGLAKIDAALPEIAAALTDAQSAYRSMDTLLEAKKESFAEVRRGLHLQGALSADTFVQLTRRRDSLLAQKQELETLRARQITFELAMRQDLIRLQQIWHEHHQARLSDIARLNASAVELRIDLAFKADRDAFTEKLRALISGTLQRPTLEKIARAFSDGPELYLDLFHDATAAATAGLTTEQIVKLRESLAPHLKELLAWRCPDRIEITYKAKPLAEHSLGQRATALMLFLLTQEDFDLLIVDQPEDDLDNQTLFEEVVTRLIDLKGRRQLVFATHSPTIPVLGDAEQVVRCAFNPSHIETKTGGIDDPVTQQDIILIMEGGSDALARRQQIYESWKPSNS